MNEIPPMQFRPRDFIKIVDLNFSGRVERCIFDTGGWVYDVEYWRNGERMRGEFAGDEIAFVRR